MPAFSFRHVKNLYPTFWSKSCEFIELLTAEVRKNPGCPNPEFKGRAVSVVNISAWLSRATLEILGTAGLGHDFAALTNEETDVKIAYQKVFSPSKVTQLLAALSAVFPRWFVRGLPVKRNGELEEAAAVIKKVCKEMVENSKAKKAKTNKTGVDLVSVAIESGFFNDEELADQLMTFLAAG
jgi:cytochrome P450